MARRAAAGVEVRFDLSKCLFIFGYNDGSRINPILLDRMHRIYTRAYVGKKHENFEFRMNFVYIEAIVETCITLHLSKEDTT